MARLVVGVGICALAAAAAAPGSDMPKVNIDMGEISVSGISSGAFFAMQMHVSYSKTINGAGMIAGGPYWCAEDWGVARALTACMSTPSLISPPYLEGIISATALSGFADSTDNLATARVWLLSGANDTVVNTGVVRAAEAVYKAFLQNSTAQLEALYGHPGEHAQLTDAYGNPCTSLGKPYINNCGLDAAGSILQHLVKRPLQPADPSAPPRGELVKFSQAAFISGLGSVFGMQDTGYVYVPPGCKDQKAICPLHVAFHGCEMTLDDIGELYVQHGGYQPWADANDIVVLMPQAKSNVFNPKGCWDWWGYTGTAYASNVGAQTLTVKRFIDTLTGQPLTPNTTLTSDQLDQQLRRVHASVQR